MISKILGASTAHITKTEDEYFQEESFVDIPKCYVYKMETGYFISVMPDEFHEDMEGWSEGLIKLLEYARKNDCSYIRLDPDEDIIEGIPVYEW
jgi:negative regulator of genetic competence, sporulation and motility